MRIRNGVRMDGKTVTIDEIVELWILALWADQSKEDELDLAEKFAGKLHKWLGNVPERFDAFEKHVGHDMTGWLLDLISSLAIANRTDDAINNCERFAHLGNAEVFLGDRVMIMSEAGRHEEAIVAANELLDRFPDHAWSHILAADAFRKVGDDARAEASYRKALKLDPTDSHTVEGVLERLVPWFEQLGRAEEANRISIHARSRLSQPPLQDVACIPNGKY